MKISIVIPVYNVAPYIKDCLHSVMVQSWQDNLECILVDDCGKDNSMQLVEERLQTYKGKIDFRIIRHQHNRGLSAARNTGIDIREGLRLRCWCLSPRWQPDQDGCVKTEGGNRADR